MSRPILLLMIACANLFSWSGESYQPLFVVERSNNANVVHYDAKIDQDGQLNPREPVIAYWIMAAQDGHRQELNLLEKSRAYGLIIEPSQSADRYRVALVSEKQREIQVYREGDKVRAETTIGGHRAYLRKIYVAIRKGTFFSTPSYLELMGTDVATGETLQETIIPR